ncbi:MULTISPECIES: HU family DNA-binding protein [unclassified Bacteroides]|uniref:HU family DNA-binding protein n=1 Tax=unclassified Bacteroides TaxID=2646097 RepID=UPI0009DDCB98|nr:MULTISPECIES: HU family DNA-binding protein [unclassified Bacteroides]
MSDNNKLLVSDLCTVLMDRHKITKNDAKVFISTFFDVILEGLEQDRIVKIKGLGTFKLVNVESRESINVSTGERFEISGHTKITFVPENGLKQQVNRPFADFTTTKIVSDEVANLIGQNTNIVYGDDDDSDDDVFDETDENIVDTASANEMTATEDDSDFTIVSPADGIDNAEIQNTPSAEISEQKPEENHSAEAVADESVKIIAENEEEPENQINIASEEKPAIEKQKKVITVMSEKSKREVKVIRIQPLHPKNENTSSSLSETKQEIAQPSPNVVVVERKTMVGADDNASSTENIAPQSVEPKTEHAEKPSVAPVVESKPVEQQTVASQNVENVQNDVAPSSEKIEERNADSAANNAVLQQDKPLQSAGNAASEPVHSRQADSNAASPTAAPRPSRIVELEEESNFFADKKIWIVVAISVIVCILFFFIGRFTGKSAGEKQTKELYVPLLQNAQETMKAAQQEADKLKREKKQLQESQKKEKEQAAAEEEPKGKKYATFASCSDYKFKVVGIKRYHELKNGESLLKIAEQEYGSAECASYIVKLNKIKDANKVNKGTVLAIPKLEPVK